MPTRTRLPKLGGSVVVSEPVKLPTKSRISRMAIDPLSKSDSAGIVLPTASAGQAFYIVLSRNGQVLPFSVQGPSSGASYLPDPGQVAIAAGDGIELWDLSQPGKAQQRSNKKLIVTTPGGVIQSIAANRDAKNPLLACGAKGSVVVLDMANAANPETVAMLSRLPGNTWSCAWSPDNRKLAFAAHDRLMVWHDDHQTHEVFCAESEINSIAWSAVDPLLAVGTDQAKVHLVDTHDWTSRTLETPFQHQISAVAFSASGDLFCGKCWGESTSQPGLVCVWRTDTWEQVLVLEEFAGKDELPPSVGFLPDSDSMISLGDDDRGVRKIDLSGFITQQQREANSLRRSRREFVAGSLCAKAIWSLQTELDGLHKPMIAQVEETLRQLEGKQFSDVEEMRAFASTLTAVLTPLGLRVQCPTGKYAGLPARLSVANSGPSREPRFCFLINDGKKTKAITEYANGMRVPALTLCEAPEDGRRTRFNSLKPELESLASTVPSAGQ